MYVKLGFAPLVHPSNPLVCYSLSASVQDTTLASCVRRYVTRLSHVDVMSNFRFVHFAGATSCYVVNMLSRTSLWASFFLVKDSAI